MASKGNSGAMLEREKHEAINRPIYRDIYEHENSHLVAWCISLVMLAVIALWAFGKYSQHQDVHTSGQMPVNLTQLPQS